MARKVPPPGAAQKYPFTDMTVGQTISLLLDDRGHELRLRKAVSAVCRRKGWVITGNKLAQDLISFVRIS